MALNNFSLGDIGSLFTGLREAVTGEKIQDPSLKLELLKEIQNAESKAMQAQASVIVAEANGESWLQRNWRPMLMVAFGFIIVNNYILVPYFNLFGIPVVALDIPPPLWTLLQLGIGGYIASRGAEKMVTTWKAK